MFKAKKEQIQVYLHSKRDSQGVFKHITIGGQDSFTADINNESFSFVRSEEYGCFVVEKNKKHFHLFDGDPIEFGRQGDKSISFTYFEKGVSLPVRLVDMLGASFVFHVLAVVAFSLISVQQVSSPVKKVVEAPKADDKRIEKLLAKIKKKEKKIEIKKVKPKQKIAQKSPTKAKKKPSRPKLKKVARVKKNAKPPKKIKRRVVQRKKLPKNVPRARKRPNMKLIAQRKAARAKQARAQAVARKRAQAVASLSFLGKGPSKFSVNAAVQKNYKPAGGAAVAAATNLKGKAGGGYLGKASKRGGGGGPIVTRGSRSFAGQAVSGDEVGSKDFNNVQGRVSAGSLSNAGSGGAGGGYFQSGSMNVKGNIDESAIKKVLQKYMSKFTYCYEKQLINKPNLAGVATMRWNIMPGGRVSSPGVAKSTISSSGLHGCLAGVLKTIKFPSPKGGAAQVSYPFAFKSSSI